MRDREYGWEVDAGTGVAHMESETDCDGAARVGSEVRLRRGWVVTLGVGGSPWWGRLDWGTLLYW